MSSLQLAILMIIVILGSLVPVSEAGPAAYGLCQAACAAAVVACYSAAGLTFGTVTAGAGVPAAAIACNAAFAKCSAACAAAFLAPIPWRRQD